MRRGFTLLEVLVATTIMAVAVTALVGNLTGSLRNLDRLTQKDRAATLAKRKMEELLLKPALPRFQRIAGPWDPPHASDQQGWQLRVTPFDVPPAPMPGMPVLDRLELEAWWMDGGSRRTYTLTGYRPGVLTEADLLGGILRE
ncbi:MAG: prepilin-type N-terminal cleavage/methylation domain-containing protein [Bryobacteraceae bacterium]|nr:prepilin-type N-terminal cleavage/methylation domain-containing protein [Bryobacteraceae bacterium]